MPKPDLETRKTAHRTALRGAVLALALTAAACAQPGEPVTSGAAAQHPQVEMRFTPTTLAGRLAFDDILVNRRGDLTRAALVLRNPESRALNLQYQASWTDEGGFPVGNATTWRRLALASGETETLRIAAPEPAAERLVLQVRTLD